MVISTEEISLMHREISYIGAHNQLERRLNYTREIKFIEMLNFSILLATLENAFDHDHLAT